jgi:hypothetical protein|nr:MAG TPA: hypothetical protein [Caudoviricetes sp.]
MAEPTHGIYIDGKSDNSNVAMLVDIIPTPLNTKGTHKITPVEGHKHFCTYLTSDTQFGRSEYLRASHTGTYPDIVIARDNIGRKDSDGSATEFIWDTAKAPYPWLIDMSVVAVLVWRVKV